MEFLIIIYLLFFPVQKNTDQKIGEMVLYKSTNDEYYIKYKGEIPDCDMKAFVDYLYDCEDIYIYHDSLSFENESHGILDSAILEQDTCKPQRKLYKI